MAQFGDIGNGTQPPPTGGFPDTGNGFFADKLTYEQWFLFRKAQQCHLDTHESIMVYIVFAIAGVVSLPIPTTLFLGMLIIGKVLVNHCLYAKSFGSFNPMWIWAGILFLIFVPYMGLLGSAAGSSMMPVL